MPPTTNNESMSQMAAISRFTFPSLDERAASQCPLVLSECPASCSLGEVLVFFDQAEGHARVNGIDRFVHLGDVKLVFSEVCLFKFLENCGVGHDRCRALEDHGLVCVFGAEDALRVVCKVASFHGVL